MNIPRIIIAAPGSGQGKTTVSMGLMAALVKRGLKVQPYKVGPDYIDPAFHTAITGRSSINLDSWMLEEEYIKGMLAAYSKDADISVIEGVMGLYDGKGDNPMQGSTAGMSKLLDTPVILILQASGMAASAAALVHGLISFGNVDIRGVIINKPSSENHYNTVKNAIEKHTGVRVLGFLPKAEDIELKSRHLGLVQSCETENLMAIVDMLAEMVEANISLDMLLEIANGSKSLNADLPGNSEVDAVIKIAVARDEAFNFYYEENLQVLRRLGAELVFFSPLKDEKLPEDCSGIYIGGGYPEVYAEKLYDNKAIRQNIYDKYLSGIPIFAECGGYMYLNKGIALSDNSKLDFVGIFNGVAEMTGRLQNFGYSEAEVIEASDILPKGIKIKVHEFHKSIINRMDEKHCIKLSKQRNGKLEEWYCGMFRDNVFGMYPHVYFPTCMKLAVNFFYNCRKYSENR